MFWENFVALCNKRYKSPNKVCAELGYSSATATKWKGGSIPRDTTLQKIADYFGITIDDLLRDPSEPAPVSPAAEPDPVLDEFTQLLDQLTVKELRELKAFMLEKINSRK